jgi:hypothetical protein
MEVHRSVQEFFHEQVTDALKTEHVEAREPTEFYLVNLLVEFTTTNQVDQQPLARKMAQAKAGSPDERAKTLKEIGDTTLYVSGFFADSLTRKLVDVEYYIAMGESAYSQLAAQTAAMRGSAQQFFQAAYDELSGKFPRFVDVLQVIRARTSLGGGANLIKLCEEWMRTGEEWIEKRLRASGVVLTPGRKLVH